MTNIETILTNLKELKDKLYTTDESHDTNKTLFTNMVKLDEVESKLYETLLILYSTSKAELDLMKHANLTNSSLLIDHVVSITTKLSTMITELETVNKEILRNSKEIKEVKDLHNNKFFTFKNILSYTILTVGTIGILSAISYLLPDETTKLYTFILSLFSIAKIH